MDIGAWIALAAVVLSVGNVLSNLIGARRNDEIRWLREKVRELETRSAKCEADYETAMREITALRRMVFAGRYNEGA